MGQAAPTGVAASGAPVTGDRANAVVSGVLLAIGPGDPFAFRGPMNLELYASINTTLTTTAGSKAATVASATGLAVGAAINSVNVPRGTTVGALVGTAVTLALPAVTYGANASISSNTLTGLPPGVAASLVGSTVSGPGIVVGTTVLSTPADGSVVLSAAPTSAASLNAPVPFRFALAGAAVVAGVDTAAVFTGAGVAYSGTVQLERSFDGGGTWLVCNIGGAGALAQYNSGTPVSLTFGEPEQDVLYRLNCVAYTSGTINYRISQTGGAAESLAVGPLSGG